MFDPQELLARASRPAQDALRLHPFYRGKVATAAKCPVRSLDDLSIWYSPGVAAPCSAIQQQPELVWEYTNRANVIAVVSDCSRVLGLGNIGPAAGLPVMEGKALLFKYLGGVDAVPLVLDTKDADEIIRTVQLIQPGFGGINLEDIAQPRCFRVLDTCAPIRQCRSRSGTMTSRGPLGAAGRLVSALKGWARRCPTSVWLWLALRGQRGHAAPAAGQRPEHWPGHWRGFARHPAPRPPRRGAAAGDYPQKWQLCTEGNVENRRGGIAEACAARMSASPCPGRVRATIKPEWVRGMARDAILFPCANPVPEIWPWEAKEAGARIVGTGRSDLPNQLNNSLGFPGIFRGTLDVRARTITDEMCLAAAAELARCAEDGGLSEERIIPKMDEWEVFPREAVAVAIKAQEQGVARREASREVLYAEATTRIREAREAVHVLMREGLISPPPEN